MAAPKLHFFVCCNRRESGQPTPGCGENGGPSVAEALRRARQQFGMSSTVYVSETACLGPCPASGTSVVVYPQGIWYAGVTVADVDEITREHILAGRPVKRLLNPDYE